MYVVYLFWHQLLILRYSAVLPSTSCWPMPLGHQIIKPNLLWSTQMSPRRTSSSERNSKLSRRSIATSSIWYTTLTNPARIGKVSTCQLHITSCAVYWYLFLGGAGYITADVIRKHVSSPDLKEKIKLFVCGPPPQITSLAGKKDGPQQGEFGGILKELGYTVEQVRHLFRFCSHLYRHPNVISGLQILRVIFENHDTIRSFPGFS